MSSPETKVASASQAIKFGQREDSPVVFIRGERVLVLGEEASSPEHFKIGSRIMVYTGVAVQMVKNSFSQRAVKRVIVAICDPSYELPGAG